MPEKRNIQSLLPIFNEKETSLYLIHAIVAFVPMRYLCSIRFE